MNNRAQVLLFVAFFLLSGALGFAMSGQDAVNFAKQQNNFFYENESAEISPSVKISCKGADYWVIAVLSSGSLKSFIPVKDATPPALADTSLARRELVKTAYVLRYEYELKLQRSGEPGIGPYRAWLFDTDYVKFFNDLSSDLKNEMVDLTTIKANTGEYPAIQSYVDALKDKLEVMYPLSTDISESLLNANAFESSFVSEPDTNRLLALKEKLDASFDLIDYFDVKRKIYVEEVDKLRQEIGSANLPIETTQSLNRLASIPTILQQFGSGVIVVSNLRKNLDKVFSDASKNVGSMLEDLGTREKRNAAYALLYGDSEDIISKANQRNLSQLIGVILAEENIYLWKEQAKVSGAKESWTKAVTFYNSGNFQFVQQFAEKAKKDAMAVYSGGMEDENPGVNTDLLFTGAVFIIIAIIILYALRNRKKLVALFDRGSAGGEELHVYDWKE